MKRLFAIAALLLTLAAPLAQAADTVTGNGKGSTNCPAGDVLD